MVVLFRVGEEGGKEGGKEGGRTIGLLISVQQKCLQYDGIGAGCSSLLADRNRRPHVANLTHRNI